MIDRAALVRLAELVGVETRYVDVLGRTRGASDESLAALISAFGLPPDPAEAAALFEESSRAAPLGLGPVHLADAEEPHPTLALRLPAGTHEIVWTCRTEEGAERSGRFVAQDGAHAMPLPAGLPHGYHRLAIEAGGSGTEIDLIVAPARCHLPPQFAEGARSWGLTCQLYGVRSGDDWGVGDFTDLAQIAGAAGACGAAVLGVNPLHARFAAEPLHFSPYSPSSRTWLDYLAIDATAAPGFAEDDTVKTLVQGQWFGATRWAASSPS